MIVNMYVQRDVGHVVFSWSLVGCRIARSWAVGGSHERDDIFDVVRRVPAWARFCLAWPQHETHVRSSKYAWRVDHTRGSRCGGLYVRVVGPDSSPESRPGLLCFWSVPCSVSVPSRVRARSAGVDGADVLY